MSRTLLGLFAIICSAMAVPLLDSDSESPNFYLYTKANENVPQLLVTDDKDSVRNSNFDANRPTKLLIHGWTKSSIEIPNNQLVPAYLARGDYNVISVDWEAVAGTGYIYAISRVPGVGANVAQFLKFLTEHFNLDISKVVIIGHSLGAHVAGFTGKELQRIGGEALKLGYIVGLDAAFPLYDYSNSSKHLDKIDANFVVTIHTNGLQNGRFEPLGHASFYANNGLKQPGCGLDPLGGCSHDRTVYFYMELLQNFTFAPYLECINWDEFRKNKKCSHVPTQTVSLGDPLEIKLVPGIFSFTTNAEPIYGHL